MKIVSLTIYGYGGLEDRVFSSVDPGIQVFYGQNESGKSTIMAFIRSVLFGFPARNQSEPRLEPKNGGKYGGKVIIHTEKTGVVSIERISGRSSGEVTVSYENGRIGGEKELADLLNGMDRSMFQNIYWFGLKGLQEVENVDAESLGHYLFSAGITGTSALLDLEKMLDRAQADYYKPNGRKPIINEQLSKVTSIEKDLHKWERKAGEHQSLVEERMTANRQIKELTDQKEKTKKDIRFMQHLLGLKPLVDEKNQKEHLVNQLKYVDSFPEDGLQRYEKLQSELTSSDSRLKTLKKKEASIVKAMESLGVNEDLLAMEHDIYASFENKQLMKSKKEAIKEDEQRVKAEQQNLNHMLAQLGAGWSEDKVQRVDTSLSVKSELNRLARQAIQLEEQKQALDRQFQESKTALENQEAKLKNRKEELLSPDERVHLEEALTNLKTRDELLSRKQSFEEALLRLTSKKRADEGKKVLSFSTIQFLILVLVAVTAAAFLFIQQSWIPFVLILLLTALLIPSFTKTRYDSGESELRQERDYLLQQLKELEGQLQRIPDHPTEDVANLEKRLLRDDERNRLYAMEKNQWHQDEKKFEQVVNQFETWEKEWLQFQKEKKECCERSGLPEHDTMEQVQASFELITDMKDRIREKDQWEERTKLLQEDFDRFVMEVERFQQLLLPASSNSKADPFKTLDLLEKQLRDEQEKVRSKKEWKERLDEIREEYNQYDEERRLIVEKCRSLLKSA